eukprot:10868464-Ditylum_brightwellii.AAC.2
MYAGKAVIYWCYAYLDVIRKYKCILHSALGDCPDFIWYNVCPSIHQLIPWGSVIYPHSHNTKALDNRSFEGYYFGICKNNSLVEWFDPSTQKVKHCQTAKFDKFRTHIGNDKPMPGALAIGGTLLKANDLPTVSINTADHPFFDEPPKHFNIPLPPKGRALSIEVCECDYYLLPYINKSKATFPFHKHLPVSHRHNVWILSINNREPTYAAEVVNIFKSLQLKGKLSTISIYLVPKTCNNTRTRLEEN